VEEDLATGPQLIKATDIIGDTAFLNNAERYGYISDILVNDGRLAAVVADTRIYGRGYRAFPTRGLRRGPAVADATNSVTASLRSGSWRTSTIAECCTRGPQNRQQSPVPTMRRAARPPSDECASDGSALQRGPCH
jgi:hypothetical protein